MRNSLLIVALLALTVLFGACEGVPDGVLDKERMARLMADLHIAEAVAEAHPENFPDDSTKRALKQSVYARHGLTTGQVEESYRWYGYHMDKYVEVYDRSIEMLNEDLKTAQERAGSDVLTTDGPQLSAEGDSVDVWNGIRVRRFSANMPSDMMTFNYITDPNWERGDVYTFRAKMIDNYAKGRLDIGIDYQDGSHEYMSSNLMGDGWHEVAFAVDSARTLRSIYGTFYYESAPDGRIAYIDSVSFTRTRWKPNLSQLRSVLHPLGPKSYRR